MYKNCLRQKAEVHLSHAPPTSFGGLVKASWLKRKRNPGQSEKGEKDVDVAPLVLVRERFVCLVGVSLSAASRGELDGKLKA